MSPKCEFKGCGLEKKALRLLGIPIYWACPREADAHALCARIAELEAKVRALNAELAALRSKYESA